MMYAWRESIERQKPSIGPAIFAGSKSKSRWYRRRTPSVPQGLVYAPMRFVEVMSIEHEGQHKVFLRDPEHLCPESIIVPIPLFLVMSLLDGKNDGTAIQNVLKENSGGQVIPLEQIDRIVQDIDQHYLLDNERSAQKRRQLEEDYEQVLTRPASHANQAYPGDPAQLTGMLEGFFRAVSSGRETPSVNPRGLITPHIDLRVGGTTFAQAFEMADDVLDAYAFLL